TVGAAPGSIIVAIIETHTATKNTNEPSRVPTPMSIPFTSRTALAGATLAVSSTQRTPRSASARPSGGDQIDAVASGERNHLVAHLLQPGDELSPDPARRAGHRNLGRFQVSVLPSHPSCLVGQCHDTPQTRN